MYLLRGPLVAAAALGATLLTPAAARAASFAEDGAFLFHPSSLVTLDFEEDVLPPEGGESLSKIDAGALHGARVLELGPYQWLDLPVELPPTADTYRVSAWVRGGETAVSLLVRYADNPHDGSDEASMLYPTGRMTSDGWVEVGNDHLRVDGTRGATLAVGFFAGAAAAIDAVEIVRDGTLSPGERSGAPCKGSSDPVCGSEQICLFSQCRWIGGQVPPIPEDRDLVADYLRARMELLFGPYANRRLDLPNARVALSRMKSANDKVTYWNGFALGVRKLHDGHTTTHNFGEDLIESEKRLGMCFIEGEADLSRVVAPSDPTYLDILVSHTGVDGTLGLGPGDRLVSVDGQHPIAWARAQSEQHWSLSPTSNHTTFAELAEQLRGLITRYAQTIVVVRCDPTLGTCGGLETIDVSAIPILQQGDPFSGTQCDNRPLRHLETSPASHGGMGSSVFFGIVDVSDTTERIYGAEWNSLYTTNGNDGMGAAMKAAIAQFKADARGVVLDHRTGNGGTIAGPQIVWEWAIPSRTVSVYLDRQRAEDEEPTIAQGLLDFYKGESMGLADLGGSATPTSMPVALLLTRDVSASDWLPLGFKDAAPNVKIFAPFQTNGGFSTRYGFGYWLGMSYVMAVGDTLDPLGVTRNGRGVEPDFVVLPKQSDLIAGQDTVFNAAVTWIRAELEGT